MATPIFPFLFLFLSVLISSYQFLSCCPELHIILGHNVQFTWMISHRFDSFIVFLTVGLSPVLGSWEGADDNHRLNGSLRPYEVSVVYTADGQRIDLLVEC